MPAKTGKLRSDCGLRTRRILYWKPGLHPIEPVHHHGHEAFVRIGSPRLLGRTDFSAFYVATDSRALPKVATSCFLF